MSAFNAVWIPAAVGNYDTNRDPVVDLIVDHHTASTLDAALARFTQRGSQVSVHFIVDRDGTRYYMVDVANTAFHSGVYPTNQRSIGIEHVSLGPNGEVDAFTDAQYDSSGDLHAELAAKFGFALDRAHVWPHNQVVPDVCPGSLDLTRLIEGGIMGGVTILKVGAAAYSFDGIRGIAQLTAEQLSALIDAGCPQKDASQQTINLLTQQFGNPISAILGDLAALKAQVAAIPGAGGGNQPRTITGTFTGTTS